MGLPAATFTGFLGFFLIRRLPFLPRENCSFSLTAIMTPPFVPVP